MQYVMLSDNFGGLNTYLSPDKVGPGRAQEMVGVDVSTGALEEIFISETGSPAPTFVPKTLLTFKGSNKLYPDRYAVAQFGGILYRSHRGWEWYQTLLPRGIQYSSDGTIWDILTMPPPPAMSAPSVTGSGGSIAIGTYQYVITFVNTLGYESQPSPAASASVTVANSKVTLTLPTKITTGTTSSGSDMVTAVGNINVIRTGTRLVAGGGIQADSYITSVNYGSSEFTMSIAAGAGSGPGKDIIDAQIAKINIYRRGDAITSYLFVDSVNIGTSTYEDTKADTALGSVLTTENSAQLPENIKNICINPAGTMMCVDQFENILYFSLVNTAGANPGLYKPEQSIKSPDTVMASIYALDRFTFFTKSRNFSVFLENALDGLPVLKFIEDSEPCRLSNFVYPVEYGSRVFWNTSNGIISTDGNSILAATKYIFKKEENQQFAFCYGAVSYNDAMYFYLPEPPIGVGSSYRWVYKFTQEFGWSKLFFIPIPTASGDGTLGFFDQEGVTCGHGPNPEIPGDTANKLRYVESSNSRGGGGTYWTGEWTGDKHSALKKFRKISALFTGSIEIEVYIDGVALPNKLSNDNQNKTTRFSWWLPPETKGRAISLKIELKNTANPAAVEELGVWVGEQRREMP